MVLKDKTVHKGIRENSFEIDTAYLAFQVRAQKAYGAGNILHFECYQISRHSDQLKIHLKQKGRTGKVVYK